VTEAKIRGEGKGEGGGGEPFSEVRRITLGPPCGGDKARVNQ